VPTAVPEREKRSRSSGECDELSLARIRDFAVARHRKRKSNRRICASSSPRISISTANNFVGLARLAQGYDLVVIAGDLLDLAGHRPIPDQIAEVQRGLAALRAVCPVVVGSGQSRCRRPLARWRKLTPSGSRPGGPRLHGRRRGLHDRRRSINGLPVVERRGIRERMLALLERERALAAGRWLWCTMRRHGVRGSPGPGAVMRVIRISPN